MTGIRLPCSQEDNARNSAAEEKEVAGTSKAEDVEGPEDEESKRATALREVINGVDRWMGSGRSLEYKCTSSGTDMDLQTSGVVSCRGDAWLLICSALHTRSRS